MKKDKSQLSRRRFLHFIFASGLILFFLSFYNFLWAQSISSSSGPSFSGSRGSNDVQILQDKISGLIEDISHLQSQLKSEIDILKELKDELKNAPNNSAKKKIQEKIQKVQNNINGLNQKINGLHSKINKTKNKLPAAQAKDQARNQAKLRQAKERLQSQIESHDSGTMKNASSSQKRELLKREKPRKPEPSRGRR